MDGPIAQKLPVNVEEKVKSFLKFVINERKLNDFDLAHIGNMDKTPVFFICREIQLYTQLETKQ